MTTLFAHNPIGRAAPLAALVVAGAVIAATAMMRDRNPSVIDSPVVEKRLLRFADAPGGAVKVETAEGIAIATYGTGEGSFLRGVLRSFARDRRGADVSEQIPFELTRYADGRTSLKDTATGQLVVLDAFGATNAAMFASLLGDERTKP